MSNKVKDTIIWKKTCATSNVESTLKDIEDGAKWLKEKAERILKECEKGYKNASFNSLGELQGNAPAFDMLFGVFEERKRALGFVESIESSYEHADDVTE